MTHSTKGLAALAASLFATAALAWPFGVQGNGKMAQSRRAVTGFTQVELELPIDTTIRQGSAASVELTVDANLAELIKTEVKDGKLVISAAQGLQPDRKARIAITMPDFHGAGVRGSGTMDVSGFTARRELQLAVAGSGNLRYRGPAARLQAGVSGSGDLDLRLEGEVDEVELGLSGSGDVRLEGGPARELTAGTSGSGDIKAKGFTARGGRFAVSGSGDIEITLGGGPASFAVAGSGDISWWGEASVSSQVASGSGEIRHR